MNRSIILVCFCLFSVPIIHGSSSFQGAGIQANQLKETGSKECFQKGLGIIGNHLNHGIDDKVKSAVECETKCQGHSGAKYFTWSEVDLSCWCSADNQETISNANTISGPLGCRASRALCCDTLVFTSSGWISTSQPAHILGVYAKVGLGTNDRSIYQQQGGSGHYLYFLDSFQIWFIGDVVGSNTGYASNPGPDLCPETIGAKWDAWSPNANEWLLDYTAKMNCA